jgi:hypothetical protein
MNKKLSIIIAVIVVAVVAGGYLMLRDSGSNHATTQKDEVTGQSTYTNLDYGFSVVYGNDWQGPAETKDEKAEKVDPLTINAVFLSTSTLEAVIVAGKPGDKESFNQSASSLDFAYKMVTVGGIPALRYEYIGAINEEGTAYAKSAVVVFKELKGGSVTMIYQKIFATEAEAKKANMAHFDDFLTHIRFF